MQVTKVRSSKWLALLAVTSAFAYTFVERYIWSSLMVDASLEFSLSAEQAGLYMSAFFLGYVIMQVPGGIFADRISPRVILVYSALASGIATALVSTIPSFLLGVVYRFVAGFIGGLVFSSCSKVVSSEFVPGERSIALGILMASPPLGITIASILGPFLHSVIGWRGAFMMIGFLALPVILMVLLFVQRQSPFVACIVVQRQPFISGFTEFIRNRSQLLIAAAGFMMLLVTTGFPTWVHVFSAGYGFSPIQSGLIATSYSLAGILGSVFSGLLSQKLRMAPRPFLMMVLGSMAVLSAVFVFKWGFEAFLAISIIYGYVSYLPPAHFTVLAIEFAKPEHSASAVASQNLFQQSASVIQPILLGTLIDLAGNFTVIWIIFATAMVLAVMAIRASRPV